MKKFISLFILMIIALTSYAQSNSVYKIYRTQNYHNQLRLNTMTGEVQQIQDDGQSWTICSAREILGDAAGRFCLMKRKICGHLLCLIHIQVKIGKSNLV